MRATGWSISAYMRHLSVNDMVYRVNYIHM